MIKSCTVILLCVENINILFLDIIDTFLLKKKAILLRYYLKYFVSRHYLYYKLQILWFEIKKCLL